MTNSTTPAPRFAASQFVLLTSVVTFIPPTIYFVGWLWQSYYLGQFNAGWLGSEMSLITYLERGGRMLLPAAVLAAVGYSVPENTFWLRSKWIIWAVRGLGDIVIIFTFLVMLFGHLLVAYGNIISVAILNLWSIQVGLCTGVIRGGGEHSRATEAVVPFNGFDGNLGSCFRPCYERNTQRIE